MSTPQQPASPQGAPTLANVPNMPSTPNTPNKPLWRIFLAFLGPMLLSNLLQSMSGTVNAIYIGQMLGVKPMAAVAAFFPVLFFFIAFVIGLGAGASVVIGQAWGARQPERVRAVTGTALALVLLFGAVIAVFGGTFTTLLLGWLGTPADILPDATRYARIMLLAMPGLLVFLLLTAMLRGVGDTLSPMLALLLSTGVGMLVTPALIQGWGGLPRMGVASAAFGTLASYSVALLWLAWRLRTRPYRGQRHPMAPGAELWREVRVRGDLVRLLLRIGVPTGVQMVVIALAEVAVLSFVNAFGAEATAAYGAVGQVVNYVQFPAISIAITTSILCAQAIGAGHAQRLPAIVRTGLLMNLVLTGSLMLLGYAGSRVLMRLFIADTHVVDVAQGLLHVTLWSTLLFGFSGVFSAVMRASGTVLVPTAISILAIALVEVPVAWVLSRGSLGLEGIWWSYPAAFASMLAGQFAFYWLVWRRQPVRRLV